MLRAWMTESVRPAPYHEELPGRWIAEPSWPPPNIAIHRLYLTDDGLRPDDAPLTPRDVCSPQTVGKHGGAWCPFGRGADQAGDQQEDDARSLVFDTAPLDARIEILGAPVVTLDVAADRPVANLVVRLCDVHPDKASLRVSYGMLNLAHRDGHETPAPLVPGRRYQVRIQLNDAGVVFPAGHRIRVAISTTYWPMIWPTPEKATVTVFGGILELPVRAPPPRMRCCQCCQDPRPPHPSRPRRSVQGAVRIDRFGLELAPRAASTRTSTRMILSVLSLKCASRRRSRAVRGESVSRRRCECRAPVTRSCCGRRCGHTKATSRSVAREWDCSVPRRLA